MGPEDRLEIPEARPRRLGVSIISSILRFIKNCHLLFVEVPQ
jgi:hypothetical protein